MSNIGLIGCFSQELCGSHGVMLISLKLGLSLLILHGGETHHNPGGLFGEILLTNTMSRSTEYTKKFGQQFLYHNS